MSSERHKLALAIIAANVSGSFEPASLADELMSGEVFETREEALTFIEVWQKVIQQVGTYDELADLIQPHLPFYPEEKISWPV